MQQFRLEQRVYFKGTVIEGKIDDKNISSLQEIFFLFSMSSVSAKNEEAYILKHRILWLISEPSGYRIKRFLD
jgi:hypothetical protein